MSAAEIDRALSRMAHQILESISARIELVLIGVQTRGAPLAARLAEALVKAGAARPPVGMIDINLYRDDLGRIAAAPVLQRTSIPFDIDRRAVVLVDDVLHTGRTVRAALDALTDFGRPAVVRLAALIDRGGRELPIQPDVVGRKLEVAQALSIQVRLAEVDGGSDEVVLLSATPKPPSTRRLTVRTKSTAANQRRSRRRSR
jgi:pyrimidine operon attenuation protein/uracil phosphoribosyltransferase